MECTFDVLHHCAYLAVAQVDSPLGGTVRGRGLPVWFTAHNLCKRRYITWEGLADGLARYSTMGSLFCGLVQFSSYSACDPNVVNLMPTVYLSNTVYEYLTRSRVKTEALVLTHCHSQSRNNRSTRLDPSNPALQLRAKTAAKKDVPSRFTR